MRKTLGELSDAVLDHFEALGRKARTQGYCRIARRIEERPRRGAATETGPSPLDGFYAELMRGGAKPATVRS